LKLFEKMRRKSEKTYIVSSWKSAEKPTSPWFSKRRADFLGDSGAASGWQTDPCISFPDMCQGNENLAGKANVDGVPTPDGGLVDGAW
jgi:hypothetical protein